METGRQLSWSLKSQNFLNTPFVIFSTLLPWASFVYAYSTPLTCPFFTWILVWTSKEEWSWDRIYSTCWEHLDQGPGGIRSELHSFNISIMAQNERWKLGDNLTRGMTSLTYIPSTPIILFLYWHKDTNIYDIFAHSTQHFLAAKMTGPFPQLIPAPAAIPTSWKSHLGDNCLLAPRMLIISVVSHGFYTHLPGAEFFCSPSFWISEDFCNCFWKERKIGGWESVNIIIIILMWISYRRAE